MKDQCWKHVRGAIIVYSTLYKSVLLSTGPPFIEQLGIRGMDSGFSFNYEPTVDPNTGSEFATAAFRFGHSLVQGIYK